MFTGGFRAFQPFDIETPSIAAPCQSWPGQPVEESKPKDGGAAPKLEAQARS